MMTRALLAYVGTVVVPLALGLWAAGHLYSREITGIRLEEDRKVAATAVSLLRRDLADLTDTLVARARPTPGLDPEAPAVRAALAGDTVAALTAADGALEVSLYLRGPSGGVLHAREPLVPSFLQALEGIAGYEGGLYLNGLRRAATDPSFGPDSLTDLDLRRLSLSPGGRTWELRDRIGILYPMDATRGQSPAVAVLVAPSRPRSPPIAAAVTWLGFALGVVLLASGWWLFGRSEGRNGSRGSRAVVLLICLALPLLAAWTALVVLVADFGDRSREAARREIARSLAVAASVGTDLPARELAELTGFEATIVDGGGGVIESTLPAGDHREAVTRAATGEGSPATGILIQGGNQVRYAARRRGDGAVIVLSGTGSAAAMGTLDLRLLALGIVLGLAALFFVPLSRGDRSR